MFFDVQELRRKRATLRTSVDFGGALKPQQNRESAHISLAPIPAVRFEEADATTGAPA
jgi:hypothetical protein